ncbi:hypothetical protein IC620_14145 [Hazenella sp. IB182357]|uniref:CRISPR-associated protein n=1 Tax=Polycladospora coralii TaxID=2771432 RepID=A0A926NAV7_9BACL|nr:hypothetical protein [Polycladospora coralii]
MNLPQITAQIGEAIKEKRSHTSELAMLVKTIEIKKEESFNVFMTIDLDQQEIRFEDPAPYSEESCYLYHYFHNNASAGRQYFLTRRGDAVSYLLKSVFSDLFLSLKLHSLHEGELGRLLEQMSLNQLITLADKAREGTVALHKIKGITKAYFEKKNKLVVNGESIKLENILHYLLDWGNKNAQFALVIPRVLYQQKMIVLSEHPEYVAVCKKEQMLTDTSDVGADKLCYICHKIGSDVSSEQTKKLSRSGINKIFVTTTINYAKNISDRYYDDSYAMCSKCYQNLLYGEKKIQKQFSTQIAGEQAFILPEGLLDTFNYAQLLNLKTGTDLFFEKELIQNLDDELEVEMENFRHTESYVIHFFLYRTGKKKESLKVLKTIEDVPTLHLVRIIEQLGEQAHRLYPHLKSMSLGMIYRMIPVRTNKDKKQLNIQNVLSVYQSLFSRTLLEANVLFEAATEALEKGFREIRKAEGDQFVNLGWKAFIPDGEDLYFQQLTMRYLCLFQTCQSLGVLDRNLFQKRGVPIVEPLHVSDQVQEVEEFLEEQAFDRIPRALFYLGVLLKKVAQEQYKRGHKKKPILNKIAFQGMNQREVIQLYQDIVEKLRQYESMTLTNEQYLNRFNYYLGSLTKEKALTEQEHIFYLMAGYSFLQTKFNKDEVKSGEAEDSLDMST